MKGWENRRGAKTTEVHLFTPTPFIPYCRAQSTGSTNYKRKLTQKYSISQKADIGCLLLSPLIFVREFLLQMTPHTRDRAVPHFPTEHYLSLFFVFKDTLAMVFLFLSKSLARSPEM